MQPALTIAKPRSELSDLTFLLLQAPHVSIPQSLHNVHIGWSLTSVSSPDQNQWRDMTLVGPFAHSSSYTQMGCCTSMGPKNLGAGLGGFSFIGWGNEALRMWMQKEVSSSLSVSKTTAGPAVFAPWGIVRRLPGFGLCCFLSFYCMNSPKIHINITFSLGLNQVMNNKSKQQLPSTMPVKFHVLILRDCDWFFHSFSVVLYEMWLDIWSLSAAQLPALLTGMRQW